MSGFREEWENIGFVKDYDHNSARLLAINANVGDVWDAIPNFSGKSDLFRLLVVFKYGGWYADADIVPLQGLVELSQHHNLVLFNEACGLMWCNNLKIRAGLSTMAEAPQFRSNLFAAPKHWRPLQAAVSKLKRNVQRHRPPWTISDQITLIGPGLYTSTINEFPGELLGATIVSCRDQKDQLRHLGMRTWLH